MDYTTKSAEKPHFKALFSTFSDIFSASLHVLILHCPDACLLLDLQPIQQPCQLSLCDLYCFPIFCFLPLEVAALKPLVQQPESCPVPVEDLQLVMGPVAEDIHRIREWVLLEFILHDCRIGIDAFSQICHIRRNIDAADIIESDHNPLHARTILFSASSFRSSENSIAMPLILIFTSFGPLSTTGQKTSFFFFLTSCVCSISRK